MMTTKTLCASLDPALYMRTQRTAREEGRKQSAVVAEALAIYTALPTELRQLLRELGVSRSPDVATALTAQLRGAALELRWERLMERLRREMDSAQLERFDAATTEELDGLAKEAVTATRPSKT
jgi:hypothetical protein